MAADYITSAEQTMTLVRRLAAHLAAEPNLPTAENLTRGEVDAWIRALNTGIHGRVIDLLALPVLECLLYMRGRNLAWKTKHLRRAPCEMFQPVVVNPWVQQDITLNREHLPWIPGDHHQAIEINDDAEDLVDTDEQAVMKNQDTEEDFTSPEGEGTQLDDTLQDVDDDNDSALQTIEQDTDDQDAALLPSTTAAENTYRISSQANHNRDTMMEDVPEQDDFEENSSTHSNSDHEDLAHSTSTTSEEEPNLAYDHPDRTLWCTCNGPDPEDGTYMVLCNNHEDNDCKGKWYHLSCVGLQRNPSKEVDWYCEDCRKKFNTGVYSNGCVNPKRKINPKRKR
ncbi:unnamed protein product [Aureobasidium vineae]|uniref:PHD-type domain-containing protein n=1 Tax=Aureobasidium vineae TaxID=2773715 RepID=A0A9N8JQ81_9PEZI|nr:unnamed protein product [Aureobasidium vineae]